MARRRKDEPNGAVAVVFLMGAAVAAGHQFVVQHAALSIAIGVMVLVVLGLALRFALKRRARRLAEQRRLGSFVASTDGMSGPQFEQLVARLMHRDGFTHVRIPGGAGDLGADVMARRPTGQTIVIQCKRYAQHRSVGSPDMQRFLGTCFHEHGADEAWFVTTSRFSKAAHDLGTRRGVQLVDRDRLATWMAAQQPRLNRLVIAERG